MVLQTIIYSVKTIKTLFSNHWQVSTDWLGLFLGTFLLLFICSWFNLPSFLSYVFYFLLLGGFSYFYFLIDKRKNDRIDIHNIIGLSLLLLVTGFYCLYTYDKGFTFTEGWYTFYSQAIIQGKVPYKDFQLLFTPFFTYFVFLVVSIFGINIIILRIIGALVLFAIAIISYKMIKLICAPIFASILALSSIFLMQSSVTSIFYYDYGYFYTLFNVLGFYFLLKLFSLDLSDRSKKKILLLCSSGFVLGFAFLTRQSSGLINLVLGFAIIIFCEIVYRRKKPFLSLAIFAIGILISFALMSVILLIHGNLVECIKSCFFSAVSAKGGLLTELFRWIPYTYTAEVISIGIALFILTLLPLVFLYKKQSKQTELLYIGVVPLLMILLFFLLFEKGNVSRFFMSFHRWPYLEILFFFSLLVFVSTSFYMIILAIKKKTISKDLVLLEIFSGFVFFTQFGSCTSGGVNQGQGALSLPLLFMCIDLVRRRTSLKYHNQIVSSLATMCLSIAFLTNVVTLSYTWWGVNIGAFKNQDTYIDDGFLKGLKVSPQTNDYLVSFKEDIETYYSKGDTVYSFSRFPIVYTFFDTLPDEGLYVYVPWFDVSTQDSLQKDFDHMKENLPDIVLLEQMPPNVIAGHEEGFNQGNKSVQREILEYFNDLASEGVYTVVNAYNINNGAGTPYFVSFLVLNK